MKGDGKPEPGCAGGYWPGLVPEMTSEIDGSDWRFDDSLSSDDLRDSEEIMLAVLAPAAEC